MNCLSTTNTRPVLAILFSFLSVVGSGSVAVGDFLNAPRSGLDRFFDATSGMQGARRFGEKLGAERIAQLRKALADEGIYLNVGKVDDAGNAIIRLRPYRNGRAELWLPENATAYEALHEVSHAIHWMRLGKDYRAWTSLSKVERERWVLQYIQSDHWHRLNYTEQFDAWEQFWRAPAD